MVAKNTHACFYPETILPVPTYRDQFLVDPKGLAIEDYPVSVLPLTLRCLVVKLSDLGHEAHV